MNPQFIISVKPKGEVEVLFYMAIGKVLFKCKGLDNVPAARALIRKIKRNCKPAKMPYCEIEDDHFFQILDRSGKTLCRSRSYTSKHRTRDGMRIALSQIPEAAVNLQKADDGYSDEEDDDDDDLAAE